MVGYDNRECLKACRRSQCKDLHSWSYHLFMGHPPVLGGAVDRVKEGKDWSAAIQIADERQWYLSLVDSREVNWAIGGSACLRVEEKVSGSPSSNLKRVWGGPCGVEGVCVRCLAGMKVREAHDLPGE